MRKPARGFAPSEYVARRNLPVTPPGTASPPNGPGHGCLPQTVPRVSRALNPPFRPPDARLAASLPRFGTWGETIVAITPSCPKLSPSGRRTGSPACGRTTLGGRFGSSPTPRSQAGDGRGDRPAHRRPECGMPATPDIGLFPVQSGKNAIGGPFRLSGLRRKSLYRVLGSCPVACLSDVSRQTRGARWFRSVRLLRLHPDGFTPAMGGSRPGGAPLGCWWRLVVRSRLVGRHVL
jgi:hypothetical protein